MARKRKRLQRLRRHNRWALNCEHVFAALTSGPFPSGSPDDDLIDAHLSFCPDCRRLAEALRPTESMLADKANRPDAAEGLPGYWEAQPRILALDELDIAAAAHDSDAADRRFDWRWALAMTIGGVITIVVLVGLYRVGCLIDAIHRP